MNFGKFSEKLHRDVGKIVYENDIDKLYVLGEYAKFIADEAQKSGYDSNNIYMFDDRNMLLKCLIGQLQKGDMVLFKASNGMKLFEIVENLEKEFK